MCDKCAPYDGLWMDTPRGLARCDCADGQRLSAPPVGHPPVLTPEQATVFVEMLAAIPFFPSEAGARLAIGDEMRSMCAGPQEADWLVTRMRRLYSRWPGLIEMRRVYASRYLPWDGARPIGISEHYPDGIPSEREASTPLLGAAPMRQLAGGRSEVVVEDPAVERAVVELSKAMPRLPSGRPFANGRAGKFQQMLRDLETAPQDRPELAGPTRQIITEADFERVVAEKKRGSR
jgi:hypothetical protein